MDRFDDIWKNRFNEEPSSENDWLSPDDKIWEGIAEEVLPRRKKRRWWPFWLIGGIGVVLLLGGLYFYGRSTPVNQLVSKEKSLISEKEEIATSPIKKTQDKKLSQAVDINPKTGEKTQLLQTAQKNNTTKNKNTASTLITLSDTPKNTDTYLAPESTITDTTHTNITHTDDWLPYEIQSLTEVVQNKDFSTRTQYKIDELLLPNLDLAELPLPEQNLPGYTLEPLVLPKKQPAAFRLNWQAGLLHWSHRITDDYRNDLAAFDFNYTDSWAWQTNLSLSWSFHSHFELFTGIQYERIRSTSGHNSPLEYDVSRESVAEEKNDYDLSLATPYGLAPAKFSFVRSAGLGSESVDLLVDFQSRHLLQNLSVPIGLTFYPLGQRRKIAPMLSGGIGFNYLMALDNELDFIQTHHDAIRLDKSTARIESSEVKRWHYDYRLGLGLTYRLTPACHFRLNYQWAMGLTPIFQLEQYETRVDRHQISLGMSYYLGKR